MKCCATLCFLCFICCSQISGFGQIISFSEKIKHLGFNESLQKDDVLTLKQLCQKWDSLNLTKSSGLYNNISYQEWGDFFRKKLAFAKKTQNDTLISYTAFPLATILHASEKFTQAIPYLSYLSEREKLLPSHTYNRVLLKLEESYSRSNDLKNAIRIRNFRIARNDINTFWSLHLQFGLYEEALDDFLKFQVKPDTLTKERLRYYFNLGNIYKELRQYKEMDSIYNKGLYEAKIMTLHNKQSLLIDAKLLTYYLGYFTTGIGYYLMIQKKFKKAIPLFYYDDSLNKIDITGKRFTWTYLALSYIALKNKDSAKFCIKKMLHYAALSHYDTITQCDALSKYYSLLEKKDSAYKYLEISSTAKLNDIYQKNKNRTPFYLLQFDNSKRRKELSNAVYTISEKESLLNKQNQLLRFLVATSCIAFFILILLGRSLAERNKQKATLEKQHLQLKEYAYEIEKKKDYTQLLLGELNHRVKNNLQLINSFLNIQKRGNTNEEFEILTTTVQTRIQALAFAYQNLSYSDNYSNTRTTLYFENLIDYIQQFSSTLNQNIRFQTNFEDLELAIDELVSLGLIMNEVISNAFKYAFQQSEKGNIYINLSRIPNGMRLVIGDDGNSIKNESQISKGSGIKIIEALVKKMNGSLTIKKVKGFHYEFLFPNPKKS